MFLLLFDAETTGLDPARDVILEIGWGLAEMDYTPIAVRVGGVEVAPANRILVRHGDLEARLAAMPAFVQRMHEASGLVADLRNPDLPKMTLGAADEFIAAAIDAARRQRSADPDREETVKIAGSGVGFDRAMIEGTIASTLPAAMPLVDARLAYGLHDTSTLRDFAMRTLRIPQQTTYPARAHRGEDDIRDHIEEADAYRRIIAAALGDDANIARLVREHGRRGYRGIAGE